MRPVKGTALDGSERQRYLGWVLVSLSAFAWSTAGFFTRLIEEDVWTMLFWRGVFGGWATSGSRCARNRRGRRLDAFS